MRMDAMSVQEDLRMSAELTESQLEAELRIIKQLFGPPAIFRSESAEVYYAIMARCIESIKPRNFLERMQVKHMTDDIWKAERYKRHQVSAIDRRDQAFSQLEKQRTESEAARNALERRRAGVLDGPIEEEGFQKVVVIEACNVVSDELNYLDRFFPELNCARALEKALDYYDRLESLGNASIKRINDAFNQIERYRQSVAVGLPGSQVVDALVGNVEDGSEAPPLAPTDD
jgi:hypothetical protein